MVSGAARDEDRSSASVADGVKCPTGLRFAAKRMASRSGRATMNRNMLLGLSLAGALAAGVAAQSTAQSTVQDPTTSTRRVDDRQVTVQGCLERDPLYNVGTTGDG